MFLKLVVLHSCLKYLCLPSNRIHHSLESSPNLCKNALPISDMHEYINIIIYSSYVCVYDIHMHA